jgi:hypothetical protein
MAGNKPKPPADWDDSVSNSTPPKRGPEGETGTGTIGTTPASQH